MRMLSDDDNSFNIIIHNLSCYEYVNRVSPHIFCKPHPKRLNLGGCVLKEGTVNFDFEHSSFELSEILYEFMKGKYNVQTIQNLIQRLNDFTIKAPYRTKNSHNITSGGKILTRLVSISQYNQANKNKNWSSEQIHFINQSLLLHKNLFTKENFNALHNAQIYSSNILYK